MNLGRTRSTSGLSSVHCPGDSNHQKDKQILIADFMTGFMTATVPDCQCFGIFLSLLLRHVPPFFFNSEYVKSKGSVASLGSAENLRGMDDISEYDDDVRNFVEDGSFVGKYSEKALYK